MTFLHPPCLRPGDEVALISPSGPLASPEVARQSAKALENLGFKVRLGKHAAGRFDYLAGTAEQRLEDLNAALNDDGIKAVFCTRGGYGAPHLLKGVDYGAAKRSPKIFAGYSDISALHAAFLTQAGLCTLHAPMIAGSYVAEKTKITEVSHAVHMHSLTEPEPIGSIRKAMDWRDPWIMRKGKATGLLIGGNLAVMGGLVGTPYFPNPDGAILFIEDIGEEPYRLDRFVTQMDLAGILERLSGIILGQFTDCKSDDPKRGTVEEMLERTLAGVDVPIIGNFPTGHVPVNASLPLGCQVELDADGGDVVFVEAFAK